MRSTGRTLTALRGRAPRIGLAALGVSSLGLLRCSPERSVLVSSPATEAAGGTSAAGTGAGGTFVVVAGASSIGAGGTLGGAASAGQAGMETGGGVPTSGATATGGQGAGGATDGGMTNTCTSHDDCGLGSACVANICQPCAAAVMQCPASCPVGFVTTAVTRNGCSLCECVPPSNCSRDQDCAASEVCYAGAQCQEGCSTPDCCFGNHCGAPGCGSTVGLNCGAVGCPLGGQCFSVCAEPTCTCDGANWQCQGDGAAGSSNSCPWVCTAR
jgi:hypothetical protein